MMRAAPAAGMVLAAALALAGTAPGARAGAPAATATTANPDFAGIGPLRFGMTAAEARAAWGQPLEGAAPEHDPQGCYYLAPPGGAHGVMFMVEGGRFVRVDVATKHDVAPGGGRIGMRVAEIRRLYAGRVTASPGKYDAAARVLTVAAPSGTAAKLIFTTDAHGVVTAWRIGIPPQVDYVEGCG